MASTKKTKNSLSTNFILIFYKNKYPEKLISIKSCNIMSVKVNKVNYSIKSLQKILWIIID